MLGTSIFSRGLAAAGGRHRNDHTSDVLLWTATDGSGESWTPYSLSAAHNAGMPDPSLRYDANVNSTTFSPRETNRLLLIFKIFKNSFSFRCFRRRNRGSTGSYTSLVALTESRALVVYDMILHRRVNTMQLNTQCVNWPIQGEHNRLQTMLLAGLRFHANAVLQGTRPRQVRLPEKPAHHSASVAVPLFRCSVDDAGRFLPQAARRGALRSTTAASTTIIPAGARRSPSAPTCPTRPPTAGTAAPAAVRQQQPNPFGAR